MPTDRREAKNVMKGTIALTLQNGMICEAIHPEGDAIFRTSGISTRFAMTSPIVRETANAIGQRRSIPESQSKRVKLNQVCNAVLYRLMSVTMPPVMNSVKVSCL